MSEKILFTSSDSFIIQQIGEILKQNNIPFSIKTNGAGQYLKITTGNTLEESNIYVNEENYEKAAEIIERFSHKEENEITEEEKNEEKKYHSLIKYGIIGFIMLPIIVIIVCMIVAIINQ